jgi:CDP-diacylglycerol--glycerol-3-phosphate 3-phosphatidyltransferase
MLHRIWTISTILSFSRIVLLAPLAYFLFADFPGHTLWAASMIVAAAITDFLDGYLARRLHQVTDFGKIADPLADKICAAGCSILLVVTGLLPLWYLIVVIARDVLLLFGSLYIRSRKNIITQSNWPGKIAVTFIAVVMFLSIIGSPGLEGLRQAMIVASIVMMALSFVIYVQRLFVGNLFVRGSKN